ncbi:MAG: hypothetical protein H3C58_14935 [Fimbriimonadaceae bacterium]|nr:hypothetical protein [Fimbriimonadaceae bacterium]
MKKHLMFYGSCVALATLSAQITLLAVGCGGEDGGGGVRPTLVAVMNQIANATNENQMRAAFSSVESVTPIDVAFSPFFPIERQLPPAARDVAIQAELGMDPSGYVTIGSLYASVAAQPEWGDGNLHMTVAQVVAALNAALPGAYANPEGSDLNRMLVLMTSPGDTPLTTAPVVTEHTRLSPIRAVLFANFLASLWVGRDACRNLCRAGLTAMMVAISAAAAACAFGCGFWCVVGCAAVAAIGFAAAQFWYEDCLAGCHNQGGNLQDAKNALPAGAN